MNTTKPEILAPAGNLEKLKAAIDYGADAVYLGGNKLNLTALSKNFSNEDMLEGIRYCHEREKKVYVTLNIFARNYDLKGSAEYIKSLYEVGVDAVIIPDPSLIGIIKDVAPELEIHLSAQANTVNYMTTKFWYEQGIKRVALSSELTFEEIDTITKNIPQGCDIEAFVHGSKCIAYSGRSLISNYMVGRDADTENCSNNYYLLEETRPEQYYPVIEDKNGTYIMNFKDLCMIHYVPQLVQSGISSFKIEGIMESEFYVASVVKAYREALDSYFHNLENFEFKEEWMNILNRASSKQYHTGFYLGSND